MSNQFTMHMKAFGKAYLYDTPEPMGASTDMGKSYASPFNLN